MTDGAERSDDRVEGTEAEEEEEARTPFDNPYFLPVVLLGFALWMGYDGWLNQDFIQAKLEEGEPWKVSFNQWGAGISGALGAFLAIRARRNADGS